MAGLEKRLEDVEGTYFDILARVNPETIQHAEQLFAGHRHMPLHKGEIYWPADFALFIEEKGDIILYLVGCTEDRFILAPSTASTRLTSGAYLMTGDEIEKIRDSRQAARIIIGNVECHAYTSVSCAYRFSTSGPFYSNEDERKIVEKLQLHDTVGHQKIFAGKS